MQDFDKFLAARTKQEWEKCMPEIISIASDMSSKTQVPYSFCIFATLEILKLKVFSAAEIEEISTTAKLYKERYP